MDNIGSSLCTHDMTNEVFATQDHLSAALINWFRSRAAPHFGTCNTRNDPNQFESPVSYINYI